MTRRPHTGLYDSNALLPAGATSSIEVRLCTAITFGGIYLLYRPMAWAAKLHSTKGCGGSVPCAVLQVEASVALRAEAAAKADALKGRGG